MREIFVGCFVRYRARGLIIRSENAAKPGSQAGRQLINWITNTDKVSTALDYGCGKLRYSQYLLDSCDHLTLVDSDIQLKRTQTIFGEKTTIFQYIADHWPDARVLTIDQFKSDIEKYDLILCANVLPVIPRKDIRRRIIDGLLESLNDNGKCLFVVQYRNSEFIKMKNRDTSIDHYDGWIAQGSRGNSFYGLIRPKRLHAMVRRAGFRIVESWLHDGSAYVVCTT